MTPRCLLRNERALLEKILARSRRAADYLGQLDDCLVIPVDALGSLQFVHSGHGFSEERHRFIDVKGVLVDNDGIPILLCLFEDEAGRLYELDIQKMGGGKIEVEIDSGNISIESI
jgi:hypothetical protein